MSISSILTMRCNKSRCTEKIELKGINVTLKELKVYARGKGWQWKGHLCPEHKTVMGKVAKPLPKPVRSRSRKVTKPAELSKLVELPTVEETLVPTPIWSGGST